MASELLSQTLQHLSKAAAFVDGDNRTNKLLNCYYLSRIRNLAAAENLAIETPSNSSCTRCNTSFRDSRNFTLSIKSRKVHKEKYKKLVANAENKSRCDKKYTKKLGRKYSKLVYNVAETTCKLCNSTSKSNIRFECKDKSKPKSTEPPVIQLSALELVNPKKRKRDKNAGLILKDTTSAGSTNFTPSQSTKVIQPIKRPLPTSKSNNSKKSKNVPAEKKSKNVTAAQKQRKGILLLANVLKMNDQRQQNSSQSMLSKMFK